MKSNGDMTHIVVCGVGSAVARSTPLVRREGGRGSWGSPVAGSLSLSPTDVSLMSS